ncbi:unnamed protein product [Closterium sp. NIES-54]
MLLTSHLVLTGLDGGPTFLSSPPAVACVQTPFTRIPLSPTSSSPSPTRSPPSPACTSGPPRCSRAAVRTHLQTNLAVPVGPSRCKA